MIFCECGCCPRPNEDTINKSEAILKTLIALLFSWSQKYKREKNMESNDGEKIIGKQRTPREVPRSIVNPQLWTDDTAMRYTKIPTWQEDGMNLIAKFSTISAYTIDISYSALYHHWSRYENTITMKSGDPDLQACPAAKREDRKRTTKMLFSLRKEQGKVNSFIPQENRTGQRDELDQTLQERLGWFGRHRREAFSTISTSSTPAWTQNWWSDDKWYEERWKESPKMAERMNSVPYASGKSWIYCKSSGGDIKSEQWAKVRCFFNTFFAYLQERFPFKRRRGRGEVDSTPRRMQIFFSAAHH